MSDPLRATAVTADPEDAPRTRTRRARAPQRRLALADAGFTTPLVPLPDPPADVAMVGRWNILDRGVRPLVVRSDGTFTLFDHRNGRTDGRWLQVSDTFVSLFVDGPKRHSMSAMPDGRVFLSRHAPPGADSTPELLFRSVLSFEGTWETPYRASQYTPAPPVQMSLGADRTFCVNLGQVGEGGAVVVWSGIWARTGDTCATLDYVVWSIADGQRRMVGHGQTTLELREDGSLVVTALGDVFYPTPGTVRAEGDDPLAAAEEPEVLVTSSLVEDPPEPDPDEPPEPADQAQDAEPEGQDATDAPPPSDDAAPEAPRLAQQDAVGTVELPPVDQVAVTDPVPPQAPAVQDGSVVGPVLPVARTTTDDGTPVVVVLYADTDGALQVGALPAPTDEVADHAAPDRTSVSPAASAPVPREALQMLPVAATTVDGVPVVVVLYTDENDDLQVGAVPAAVLAAARGDVGVTP